MNYKFIAIEGNIGSGKTTLSTRMAKDLKAKLVCEEFTNNPFLPKFYEDPKNNAFPLELFFMAERFQQLIKEANKNDLFFKLIISDYMFMKSKLFAQNNLKEDEFDLFNRIFDIMYLSTKKPELIVYLHSNTKRLRENILKRGRKYERNISEDYLKNIEEKYFDYLKKQNEYQVLILDVTEVDFINSEKTYQKIFSEIDNLNREEKIKKLILS